jgi:DNA (cytosine-5)-methyltransferase 1
MAVINPFLVPYYGTSGPQSVEAPLPTATTKDRFALVEALSRGDCALDILFRMLRPHELASAMGFPDDYQWAGGRTAQVRQIGNAVEVNQARALCSALLGA